MLRSTAFALAITALSGTVLAETTRQLSDAEWLEDIDAYVGMMREIHLNPFHTISEADWLAEVDALRADVPQLTDFAIMLRMRRLAALIGDGHTWLRCGEKYPPRRLPLRLKEFSDGVFAIGGYGDAAQYREATVEAFGGIPTAELLERASQYTSGDNEWGRGWYRLECLSDEAFYTELGLLNDDDTVNVTLLRNGAPETVPLALIPDADYNVWVENESNFIVGDPPLYRLRPDETYWMHWLPEHDTLYVQFNAVQNREGGPHFVGFGREIMDAVEEHKANKLIVDLRHNGGGNGALLDPTIRRISENDRINREGRLFVLTSPKTFSAALMFTVRLERNTNALFAGTPGGGKPNSYGEYNPITLPHSGMSGSISSRWHEEGAPDDTRDYVPVDIPVELSSQDFFANRDPVLEAVLAY